MNSDKSKSDLKELLGHEPFKSFSTCNADINKNIQAEGIDCGSDDELNQDNIKIPKVEPHQKPVAIVDKTPSKLDDQSKNAATALQEPSATFSVKSAPLFTSCFTANSN
eukprot:14253397-Ditylum_brightwellii.AAC.1